MESPLCDTKSVIQFLSNLHWVEEDVSATKEPVKQRVEALVNSWTRDGCFILHDDIQVPSEEEDTTADHGSKINGDARKYQSAMAELAKQQNTIITLG